MRPGGQRSERVGDPYGGAGGGSDVAIHVRHHGFFFLSSGSARRPWGGLSRQLRLRAKRLRKNWKTLRMSRKIEAASSGALSISFLTRSRWKSYITRPAKITNPSSA